MKFYNKNWFIVLALIFFVPLGLFLMWKQKSFNKNTRIIVTIIIAVFIIVVASQGGTNTATPTQSNTKKTVEQSPAEKAAKIAADKKAAAEKIIADKQLEEAQVIGRAKMAIALKAADIETAKLAYRKWVNDQFSADGSDADLISLVKENLNNADSFQYVSTTYTDGGSYLIIKMTYRATNSFNALILQNVTARSDYKANTIKVTSQND